MFLEYHLLSASANETKLLNLDEWQQDNNHVEDKQHQEGIASKSHTS